MEANVIERPNVIHTEVAELAVVAGKVWMDHNAAGARSKSRSAGRTCHWTPTTHASSTTATSSAATLSSSRNNCERKKQKRQ